MTLEERLARLERKSRRLTLALSLAGGMLAALVVLAVAAGMAPAVTSAPETVMARKFLLVDAQGMPRATLSVSEQGPGLWLYDEKGTYRAGLGVNANGTGLMLRDDKGHNRAVLCIAEKGPELTLYDENGKELRSVP